MAKLPFGFQIGPARSKSVLIETRKTLGVAPNRSKSVLIEIRKDNIGAGKQPSASCVMMTGVDEELWHRIGLMFYTFKTVL